MANSVDQRIPASDTLVIAVLLATTGGMLDAIIYLTHGHVFANAMTGNVVLMGISATSRDWPQTARHIAPIIGFLLGIIAAKALRSVPDSRATALGLLFEILVLATLGALNSFFSDIVFVPIVAFASAFQAANFRKVNRVSYNSTFVTGNLRDMAEGAFDSVRGMLPKEQRRDGKSQASALFLICLGFLVGVLAGALLAPRFLNHALWFPLAPLIVVATILFLQWNKPLQS